MSCCGRREVLFHRFGRLRRRVRPRERRDLQHFVDRRRLVLRFREAVALRQRRHFVRVDAVDEAIEVLAGARVRPRAVRGLQHDVDGTVELDPGAVEVTQLQLALAGLEMLLRRLDQRGDRVRRRGHATTGAGAWGAGTATEPPAASDSNRTRPLS